MFDEPDKEKKDQYKQQIEEAIHELTNGKEAFDFEIYFSEVVLKKGGLARLSISSLKHGRCAELEWLLPPKVLRRNQ